MLFSSVDQQTRDKEPELFIRADRFAFYDLTDLLYMFCACGSIAYVILLSNMSLIKLFLQPFEAAFFMLFITRL